MKKSSFFLAFNFLVFSLSSSAGQPEIGTCEIVSSSQQVFECSKIEKEQADRLLNAAYNKLKARISKQYGSELSLRDSFIQRVRESQRLWVRLRDADCDLEVFEIEEGTQAYETTLNKCVARLSVERAAYLEKISPEI